MTSQEAKEILLLYRPGMADADDPDVAQALEAVGRDPQLTRWFEHHQAFQAAMRAKLRQIPVPEHLKYAALGIHPATPPPTRVWWRPPAWIAAAAALILALCLAAFLTKPKIPNRFADFEQTMVSKAIRGYAMEWETPDMNQLRKDIAAKGAPADYDVPRGLQRLSLTGGAVFPWRNRPVAMVCFDRGNKQMVFLFVMERSAVKDSPPEKPEQGKVSDFITASWTRGDKAYLLAGAEGDDFQQYLPQ